jgi:hypothetical protein
LSDWQGQCRNFNCEEISTKNSRYCIIHEKELQETAIDIFGRKEWEAGERPTILASNVSVEYAKSCCERCDRKFRFWRKCIHGFNRTSEKFIEVCSECVTEDDAV